MKATGKLIFSNLTTLVFLIALLLAPTLPAHPSAVPPLIVARDLDPNAAPPPEGCQLVAHEECGRPGFQPHKLSGSDHELKADPKTPATASPYRTCNMANNWDRAVVYQFEGLDPQARYRLRIGLPPQQGACNVLANGLFLHATKAPAPARPEFTERFGAKAARLLEFDLPPELVRTGKLELRAANRDGWVANVSLVELWADRAVTLSPPLSPPPPADYHKLAQSAWNPVPLEGRRFFFRCYASIGQHRPGGRCARFAEEAKAQGLLDPIWEWENFALADESKQDGVAEWDYHHSVDGTTKFDCYQSRRQYFLQHLIPAKAAGKSFTSFTGHGWLEPYAAEWGADFLITELGAGSPCVQARLALLRGAGRQLGIPFATQTSTWYGGMLTFYEDGEGEAVPRPGHSSWFQARTWYLSWLSGCLYACPEPAQASFFYRPPELRGKQYTAGDAIPQDAPKDRRFKLSPTGERAREFLGVTHRLPDIGIPYAPIALIMDHYAGFNIEPNNRAIVPWWRLEPTPGDSETGRFLDEAYPKSIIYGKDPLSESRMMVNSPYGESFDLLLSTVKPELLRLYPAAVLLGDHQLEPVFRQCLLDYLKGGGHLVLNQRLAGQLGSDLETFRQAGRVWVEEFTRDPASAQDLLDRLTRLYLPIEVKGDIEYTLNRTPTGWIVGLLENKGAWKDGVGPVVFKAAMSPTVTIRPRHGQLAAAREWVEEKDVVVADNTVKVRVPPGSVRIVELTVK